MSKIVIIGNGTKCDLEPLESGMETGGQGNVYFPNNQYCIKVLHEPDTFNIQLANIARLINHPVKPYDKVRPAAAVPLDMVWDEGKRKLIGYTMDRLVGWHGLYEIITAAGSESLGINLKSSGLILAALSWAVHLIHGQGFVIGDFNPSNVLFKREGNGFATKVIDVDSWSIYRKNDIGVEYFSNVLDTGVIYHPDFIQADMDGRPWPNFTFNHDWWAFTYISWMVLTKYDPFTIGIVSDADREERILKNYTSNSAATVKLNPKFGHATQALGPKLRFYLDRCLKRKVRRPFPTKILEDFAFNLRECKKCNFSTHVSSVICPRCAQII